MSEGKVEVKVVDRSVKNYGDIGGSVSTGDYRTSSSPGTPSTNAKPVRTKLTAAQLVPAIIAAIAAIVAAMIGVLVKHQP